MSALNEAEETTRLMRRIAELSEGRARYRLAWMSARRRASRLNEEADALNFLLRDHEVLHAKRVERVVSLTAERDEARQEQATLRAEQDDIIAANNRLQARVNELLVAVATSEASSEYVEMKAERDEARAEVVRLGKENEEHRRTIRSYRDALTEACAPITGGTEADVEFTVRTGDEEHDELNAASARLRAALDEERIEPKGANGHGKWCASLHAPPGQTYACDCNEVGAG